MVFYINVRVRLSVKVQVEDRNSIFISLVVVSISLLFVFLRELWHIHFFLLLKELGQLAGDGITDLCGLCLAANVAGLDSLLDDNLDGLVD